MFRFDYSIHFLRWALKPPEFLRHDAMPGPLGHTGSSIGFTPALKGSKHRLSPEPGRSWHLGVRVQGGGKPLGVNIP